MIKRAVCLVLLLSFLGCVLAFLPACMEQTKINNATEKTKCLSSLSADILISATGYVDTDYIISEEKQEIIVDGDLYKITSTRQGYGTDIIYLDNENVYVSGVDSAYRQPLDSYFSKNSNSSVFIDGLLVNVSEDMLENATYEASDKKQTLDLTLEEEMFPILFPEIWAEIIKGIELSGCEADELICSECDLSLFIYDGYTTRSQIRFTIKNHDVELSIKIGLFVNEPGTDFEVEIPANYKSFPSK